MTVLWVETMGAALYGVEVLASLLHPPPQGVSMSGILRRAIVALLLVGFNASCSEHAPTAAIGSDFRVNFNYTLTALDKTLIESEMLWNGYSFGVTSASATGMQASGVIPGVKAGANTFAIRIVSQTVTPARYSVTGVVTATRADGAIQTFPVAMTGLSLQTGQPVTQVIDITP